ncbi:MAG: polysaccharide deacetylase family protein [Anaerolineae bacterium]|nr:polysaccharide deacetylase family protein [Anaerolineae bacterium]
MKVSLLLILAILAGGLAPIPPTAAQSEVNCNAPRLVLELPTNEDHDAILQTFAFLQARNLRTLILARPENDPDTLRLAIAAGNQIALVIDELDGYADRITAWETLITDLMGIPGLPLVHIDAVLVHQNYTRLADAITACDTPPQLDIIPVDGDAVTNIYNAIAAGAVPHEAATWQYAGPVAIDAPAPEAFKAAHLVIIDPGHTRMDRGASILGADGEYVTEHRSNLQRAHALRVALEQRGWVTALAHDDGWLFEDPYKGLDLDNDGLVNNHDSLMFRAQFAYYAAQRTGRRAVIAMLHADSFGDDTAKGYTLFYPDPYETADDYASYRLALYLSDHLGAAWRAMGVETASRGIDPGRAYGRERGPGAIFDIIDWRYRELPAARHEPAPQPFIGVLIEAGMASNPAEAKWLATEKGNALLGRAHADAFEEWVGAELALMRAGATPYPNPAALTEAQIEALALGEVTHGRTDDPPRIAFTFDMGSSATNWPAFRAALRKYDLKVTIFLTGDFIRANPVTVRQMLADGHDLQNHSDTHPNFTEMTAAAIKADLQSCQETLDRTIGGHLPMRLWRAPFGARNYEVNRAAAELGMLGIWWSKDGDTTGWQTGVTAEDVYSYVTWTFAPGKIYVAHLNSSADIEAFPRIVEDALTGGYVLGTLWDVFTPEQRALLDVD